LIAPAYLPHGGLKPESSGKFEVGDLGGHHRRQAHTLHVACLDRFGLGCIILVWFGRNIKVFSQHICGLVIDSRFSARLGLVWPFHPDFQSEELDH
jgi:hypothetical protein